LLFALTVQAGDCDYCEGNNCCQYRCDCVTYARCLANGLPGGLITCDDKKRAVNSHNPRAGCVMFRTGDPQYCHAAYVTGVSGGVVSINQANWDQCHCSNGSIKADDSAIIGFWCP
jgi:hypothetical protein